MSRSKTLAAHPLIYENAQFAEYLEEVLISSFHRNAVPVGMCVGIGVARRER